MRLSVVKKTITKSRFDLKSRLRVPCEREINGYARSNGFDSMSAAYRLGYEDALVDLSLRVMDNLGKRDRDERVNTLATELRSMTACDFNAVMRRVYGSH